MHVTLYQLASEPIAKDDLMTETTAPLDYIYAHYDYVADADDEDERWESLADYDGFKVDLDTKTLVVTDPKHALKSCFALFKSARDDLADIDIDAFCEADPNDYTASRTMYRLNAAFDNAHGDIYCVDGLTPMSFQEFVRNAKPGETLYMGSALDIHI